MGSTPLLIAVVLFGGISVGALIFALVQHRCVREARRSRERLSTAIGEMSRLLLEAERIQDYSLRCANPDLAPCWEIKKCTRPDCEAYGNPNLRCWQLTRTLCRDPQDARSLFERTKDCAVCEVYRRARQDILQRLTEQFNDVMAALEAKSGLLQEARRHVQRASRLASIGEFAAGLAHEINNPLDGIMSCLARLEREPENLAQNLEYLRMIRDAMNRMSKATQQLLEYARKRELHCDYLDVHLVIENVVALMGTSARQKAIAIEFDFDNSTPLVWGDRHHLAQAFLNLALNAMAAVAEATEKNGRASQGAPHDRPGAASHGGSLGGRVLFRTRAVHPDGDVHTFVEVDVEDNGVGIDPENRARIFEPFFTTKEPGKGTGMGLTVVKGIIEEHRGRITVESDRGMGTTVRVLLPTEREPGAAETSREGETPAEPKEIDVA